MSAYNESQVKYADLGSMNLGAGAASVVFQPGVPVDIEAIVFVVTTAQATAGAVITVQTREADGSGGEVTIGTGTTAAVMALNSVHKMDIAAAYAALQTGDGGGISQVSQVTTGRIVGRQTSLPGLVTVNPGRELVISSGGEGDTGVATVYIKYYEQSWNLDRFNPTAIAFTLS